MDANAAGSLLPLLSGYYYSWALYATAKLELPDILDGGPLRVEAIAERCGAPAATLVRLLRAIELLGLCERDADGRYGPTDASAWLRKGVEGTLRPLALQGGERCFWQAWERCVDSVKTGRTGFELAHDQPMFEYLDQHAALLRQFQLGMHGAPAWNRAVLDACPLDGPRHFVDIGGGDGNLLHAYLEAYPEATGVCFERPAALEALGDDIMSHARAEFVGGDFFEAVPAGDVHLLRLVLHDWDDAAARRVLANCRASIDPQGTLLVVEHVLEPDEPSQAAMLDLTMLVLTGGRVRSRDEYRQMMAEQGFELTAIYATILGLWVLQAKPV